MIINNIKNIIYLLLGFITITIFGCSITNANDNNIGMNISLNKILDNTDDKVFVSDLYQNGKGEKYIVIVTKNYKGAYKINYLIYNNKINSFTIKKKYLLYNKNFYKNNLFIFDDNFLYMESGDNDKVYFYDKNKSYVVKKELINNLFFNGATDTDKNGNRIAGSKSYGIYIKDSNNTYVFQTKDNIKNFLSGNTVYIGASKKTFPFIYSNGKFYFYNVDLISSTEQGSNSEYYYEKDVAEFGYNNIFCKSSNGTSNGKHNYVLSFDLNTKILNVIPIEDSNGNRICYYDTNNVSLTYKTILTYLRGNKGLLLYLTRDLTNNDNFLNIYKIDINNTKILAEQKFQTKVRDNISLDNGSVLNDSFKRKFYNARKFKNIYEDDVFQVFYYKKNDFNTLIIFNKKTEKVTEFKDILSLKKIVSNMFNGNRNIEISYCKKLGGIEKTQVSKILDTDQIVNIATMNKTAKVNYIYQGIFNNILTIIGREYLYYKFLGYYNIVGKIIFSQDKKFFVDYNINGNKFSYIAVNKKDYTNLINDTLQKYLNKGLKIDKIGNIKLLDDGVLLLKFNYQKDVMVKKEVFDKKLKRMEEVEEMKKKKGKKELLFSGSKVIEMPEETTAMQFIYIFPIYQKAFIGYKGIYYFYDLKSGKYNKINIKNDSVIRSFKTGISSINYLGKKINNISKPILNYKNGFIYVIDKNSIKSINVSNGNVNDIIVGNIQKVYNYNGHIIVYNIDNYGTNNLFIDYNKVIDGNFLGLKINDNIIFLFNKKDLIIVVLKKILNQNKIMSFNNIIDSYILNLNNPTMLYYYNLFKDVIYKLNSKKTDRKIIMNLFYRHYLNSKK